MEQGKPGNHYSEGIWSGQHTWIPNDKTIVTGRYGYIGLQLLFDPGRWKSDTDDLSVRDFDVTRILHYFISPIDRPANDFNVDMNYYKENWGGGDHEFKFGFEYKSSKGHTFSSYGNGVYLYDYYQTHPGYSAWI